MNHFDVFSAELLDRVEHWSFWIALASAAGGGLRVADVRFSVSLLLGASFDITMLHLMRKRMPDEGSPAVDAGFGMLLFGRLVGKVVLVVLAFALPAVLHLWGMAVGVLVVEITLMTVGAVTAARRAFGGGRPEGS